MTRTAEGVLVAVASGLAAFGVALVDFANGESLGAQVGLTFLVFLIAFGGFHAALRGLRVVDRMECALGTRV